MRCKNIIQISIASEAHLITEVKKNPKRDLALVIVSLSRSFSVARQKPFKMSSETFLFDFSSPLNVCHFLVIFPNHFWNYVSQSVLLINSFVKSAMRVEWVWVSEIWVFGFWSFSAFCASCSCCCCLNVLHNC